MVFFVDSCDLSLNFLTNLEFVFGLSDLVVCYLADVDKSVAAGNDFSERAERHKADDLNGCNIAYSVLLSEDVPGVHFLCLVAERDSALFAVEGLYIYMDLVSNLNNFGRMLDSSPGQLGGMYHTVYAAEVNECAEICKALNFAVKFLAFFDCCPECVLLSLSLFTEYGADGCVSSLSLGLDFDNLNLLSCSNECGEVSVLRNACERCGDEYSYGVEGDDDAALDSFNDLAFECFAGVAGFNYLSPVGFGIYSCLVESCDAVDVAYLYDFSLDCVAYLVELIKLSGGVVCCFVVYDYAGSLCTEVNVDLIRGNGRDYAFDDISCI